MYKPTRPQRLAMSRYPLSCALVQKVDLLGERTVPWLYAVSTVVRTHDGTDRTAWELRHVPTNTLSTDEATTRPRTRDRRICIGRLNEGSDQQVTDSLGLKGSDSCKTSRAVYRPKRPLPKCPDIYQTACWMVLGIQTVDLLGRQQLREEAI